MSGLTSFSLLTSFPPEIIGLIISTCPVNDQICLRLTCKLFYSFPSLERISDFPLDYSGRHSCQLENRLVAGSIHTRVACHDAAYKGAVARAEREGLRPPRRSQKCYRRPWFGGHCGCFEGEFSLYKRLAPWMPKTMKYCKTCSMFTRRKRAHNNRCYHGHPKPRKTRSTLWTYHSRRGGFNSKLWKRWFNNAAMNGLESNLREGRDGANRSGSARYEMRTLKARDIDTREERNNYSIVC